MPVIKTVTAIHWTEVNRAPHSSSTSITDHKHGLILKVFKTVLTSLTSSLSRSEGMTPVD